MRILSNEATPGPRRHHAQTDTAVGSVSRGLPVAVRGAASRPGSALILVLVSLVMMVLIGTAYVQVARVDRRATAMVVSVSNINAVRESVVANLTITLRDDIFDANGDFLKASVGGDSYDYPHTNQDVEFDVFSGRPDSTGQRIAGGIYDRSKGGQGDDMWLASTYIDQESQTEPSWSKISNLTGVFLVLPNSVGLPDEYSTNGANGFLSHDGFGNTYHDGSASATPVPVLGTSGNTLGDPRVGVDTDGDGIPDARWTWAPEEVRQIGGLTYVVAYRIIDLSSMLNVNAATAALIDGVNLPAVGNDQRDFSPRGFYPTDLDVTRLFKRARGGMGAWAGETNNVLGTVRELSINVDATYFIPGDFDIQVSDPASIFNLAGDSRGGAWLNATLGARDYGIRDDYFLPENELELRARGGLNTSTEVEIEKQMPQLLRKDILPADEKSLRTVVGEPETAALSAPSVHRYMSGSPTSVNQENSVENNRTFPEIRHMLTTVSGANIYAPQYSTMDGKNNEIDRLQFDLSYYQLPTVGATAAETRGKAIADRLEKILGVGSPMYAKQSGGEIAQIAAEFAANIQDYTDQDNRPTGVVTGLAGPKRYGLEIMPFIREFYVQAAYKSADPDPTTDPMDPNFKKFRKWEYQPGSGAFVVEIGNPFDKNCGFNSAANGISLRMRVYKESAPNTALAAYDLPGGTLALPPRDGSDELREQMVIYSTPATPLAEVPSGKGMDLVADLALGTFYGGSKRIDISTAAEGRLPDSAFDGSPLTVELTVEVAAGVFVGYDRLRDPDVKLEAEYNEVHGDTDADPLIRHGQVSVVRDGRKIRYMSNKGRTVRSAKPAEGTAYIDNGASISRFGADDKGVTGDENLDKIHLAHANHHIFNVAELAYIFMVGFTNSPEGDIPSLISGKNGEYSSDTVSITNHANKRRWFLSMLDENDQPIVPSETRIPHMAMIMDQFTTISPRYDGGDNNGNGQIDEQAEIFVPGRINVNTAPNWLLALTSPIPEPLDELTDLYRAIAEYRDKPASRIAMSGANPTIGFAGAGIRNNDNSDKGIASIGELMFIRRRIGGETNGTDMLRYADPVKEAGSFTLIDPMRPYPRRESIDSIDDDRAQMLESSDDKEKYEAQERMARYQYLTNTLTTRSDMYCAYVVIRGYNSADFSGPPVEKQQFFMIIDRSNITKASDPVVVFPASGQPN